MDLCPSGRKKSHCMLAHRAACSQLRLGDVIGRNVHTARFTRRNVHTSRHLTVRGQLRARTQCDFFHQFGHKTSCVPQATWWRCDSCEYRPRYAQAGTLHTRHNRHHAVLGRQSTIVCPARGNKIHFMTH